MTTKLRRRLPKRFRATGLIAQGSLPIDGSTLRFKVVVFDSPKNLQTFWNNMPNRVGGKICRHTKGVVNPWSTEVTRFLPDGSEKSHKIFDRSHFCLIGLCKNWLGMEVICHESTHAGFAFAKRRTRASWRELAINFDEEGIAYPTGKVAVSLLRFLRKNKLVD